MAIAKNRIVSYLPSRRVGMGVKKMQECPKYLANCYCHNISMFFFHTLCTTINETQYKTLHTLHNLKPKAIEWMFIVTSSSSLTRRRLCSFCENCRCFQILVFKRALEREAFIKCRTGPAAACRRSRWGREGRPSTVRRSLPPPFRTSEMNESRWKRQTLSQNLATHEISWS